MGAKLIEKQILGKGMAVKLSERMEAKLSEEIGA
jgi:hypothetical protein